MKRCSMCNSPAFDSQKYCQKCGNKFPESMKIFEKKEKFTDLISSIKSRSVKFLRNYKKWNKLPKPSKIKHVAFPVVILLIFAVIINSVSGESFSSSSTVANTNEHNNGVVLTYCDEKRAFFDITYRQFADMFNSMIVSQKLDYSQIDENSAFSKFSDLTIACLIGQKNLYSRLNDDIVLCTVCELRTSKEHSPFDSNIAEIYILANENECDINEISRLYLNVLKIIDPNYTDEEINEYTRQVVPSSFSQVDDTKIYDENIRFRSEDIENCDDSVFVISASKNETLANELDNYESVDCSKSQLEKAVKILKSKSVQNDLGLSNNLYYTISSILGGNPEITGTVDFYGNINVKFSGVYKNTITAQVIYKVSLDYGDYQFLDSSLNWDYVLKTYQMD